MQLLHVPQKLLKEQGGESKAWMQFLEAKLAAKGRAAKEAPTALEAELKAEDVKHQHIYEVAAGRISAILGDPDHYMHGKLEKVETEFQGQAGQTQRKG